MLINEVLVVVGAVVVADEVVVVIVNEVVKGSKCSRGSSSSK